MFTSKSRLLRMGGIALEWTLGIALLGVIYLHLAPSVKGVPGPASAAPSIAQQNGNGGGGGVGGQLAVCGTSTVCITDDRTGDTFTFDCPGGNYTFTRCSDGFTISGTGTPSTVGSVEWLNVVLPDRRISADLMLTQGTGRAAISFKTQPGTYQNFFVNQTVPFRQCGGCGAGLRKSKG